MRNSSSLNPGVVSANTEICHIIEIGLESPGPEIRAWPETKSWGPPLAWAGMAANRTGVQAARARRSQRFMFDLPDRMAGDRSRPARSPLRSSDPTGSHDHGPLRGSRRLRTSKARLLPVGQVPHLFLDRRPHLPEELGSERRRLAPLAAHAAAQGARGQI